MFRQHSSPIHATFAVQKKVKEWKILALASSQELREWSGMQCWNVFRTAVPDFSSVFTPKIFLMVSDGQRQRGHEMEVFLLLD